MLFVLQLMINEELSFMQTSTKTMKHFKRPFIHLVREQWHCFCALCLFILHYVFIQASLHHCHHHQCHSSLFVVRNSETIFLMFEHPPAAAQCLQTFICCFQQTQNCCCCLHGVKAPSHHNDLNLNSKMTFTHALLSPPQCIRR